MLCAVLPCSYENRTRSFVNFVPRNSARAYFWERFIYGIELKKKIKSRQDLFLERSDFRENTERKCMFLLIIYFNANIVLLIDHIICRISVEKRKKCCFRSYY